MAEFTGRKMLAVCLAFFGVIIGVNLLLAFKAVSTFPGLEVQNGYVASQTWDKEMAAQRALGWTLAAAYDHQGSVLELVFTDKSGQPATVSDLSVLVGRPTEDRQDKRPDFVHEGSAFRAPVALGPGKWMLMVEATAPDGTRFRQRQDLFVKG